MVNWTSYNESLVRRGEVILDFDIIDGWYVELERMNEGKRGATYGYPNSFVQLLGYVKAYFHLPYRQTEGVVRAHAANKIPSIPDYSTINRHVNKLDIKINDLTFLPITLSHCIASAIFISIYVIIYKIYID